MARRHAYRPAGANLVFARNTPLHVALILCRKMRYTQAPFLVAAPVLYSPRNQPVCQ
jgi:hypothetical protein